jgi:putative endonuclease
LFSKAVFCLLRIATRRGIVIPQDADSGKENARQLGIRGETYAYWYLRGQGYVFVRRNYRVPGIKGEIDLVGYDGAVLAFVEVKTRTETEKFPAIPELAVNEEKRMHLRRMARHFMTRRKIRETTWRFDVVAIEVRAGSTPVIRLHKGAFTG